MNPVQSQRSIRIGEMLAGEAFRHRIARGAASGGRVVLPDVVSIEHGGLSSPGTAAGLAFFRRFLETCAAVRVGDPAGFSFQFEICPKLPRDGFVLRIDHCSAKIQAANEAGLLDGLHYLRHELADFEGSLPAEVTARHPRLGLRLGESVFAPGFHGVEGYPEATLDLLRHFGVNALRRSFDLSALWQSDVLPELNHPQAESTIAAIQADAEQYAATGMRYFLILHLRALVADHPVFAAHPEARGAEEEIFLEETSGRGHRVLCTGQPMVLRALSEVVANLFTQAPGPAGAIILVGGEGLHHCFMRPSGDGPTNCPHCSGQDPHRHVASLVNHISEGLHRGNPAARLLAWPYGALTWSREDRTESEWIEYLDPAVGVLSNFDCGDPDPLKHSGALLFDYNIQIAGPSVRFAAQAGRCRARGIDFFAKTETNTTPDTFFLPHIPVPFRWFERFRAIREADCSGYMGQWFFFGMNGSIPEELQYHSVWNPGRSAGELLSTIARRDFQLDRKAAAEAVEGWRELSDAWDDFPYSAMTCGEREAYMRGPWYLGPAHPLIFNEQSEYQLVSGFFRRRGDLVESLNAESIRRLQGKPRYVCNLLYCLPFGAGEFLRLAERCRERWDAGVKRFEAACGTIPAPCARREIGIVRLISCHLHTLVNTTRFLMTRDAMWQQPCSEAGFAGLVAELTAILDAEMANAERALPLLESDPRLGYGFNYGEVYDAEMVRSKIEQCRFVKERELPRVASIIRFHVWYRFP